MHSHAHAMQNGKMGGGKTAHNITVLNIWHKEAEPVQELEEGREGKGRERVEPVSVENHSVG